MHDKLNMKKLMKVKGYTKELFKREKKAKKKKGKDENLGEVAQVPKTE